MCVKYSWVQFNVGFNFVPVQHSRVQFGVGFNLVGSIVFMCNVVGCNIVGSIHLVQSSLGAIPMEFSNSHSINIKQTEMTLNYVEHLLNKPQMT